MKHSGNLTVTTPSDREIAMSRVFNAPRNLVFDAYTKPELVTRWLGVFGGWSFRTCEIDLEVGGSYRYLWDGPDGATLGIRGRFLEIAPNERIVCTERFDPPFDVGEAMDTVTFVEHAATTTLTIHVLSPSKEVRDEILRSGMTEGVTAGFDTLDGVLAGVLAQLAHQVRT
jgi:uncharacterized protein YndB with AHSA1/START domain